ncbi:MULTISPECIES: alpha/beta fold hydrolase [Providencia]|uniref:alpha/beta fold hydrolase n=1 Tax=Providencia TaxID=586 RepID=UPI000EF8AFD8|nr:MULTISPECIES: alpha/beta hydrolase [Providencia]EMF0918903.1 alpha/beta hydrolase [Providencia stuartii]MCR4079495.1 alpha/beta hydrolase [Providencia stuartii]MTC18900.1 alpha/beta fold hydrolase [Providencia stuartii]RMA09143.1 alpha/beta hydrolase [Providencia stuartii]
MKLPIEHLPTIQTAEFGSYHLNWREAGNGETVILLHGISSGSASWIYQLTDSSLTQQYRLLAWDAPGYLNSRALTTDTPTANDYAEALAAFIDGLDLPQVVLVGHSLGAIMACAFAAKYPQKIKGLFLANPAQGYATKHKTEQRQVYEQRREIVFNSGIEYYAQHRAAALLSSSASEPQIDWVRQTMRKLNPRGFLAAAWMLAHDDISRYLNLYSGPVQMVVGLDDTITPPEKVHMLAQQHSCPLTYIERAGHASYLDASQPFNHYLKQFLATYAVVEV